MNELKIDIIPTTIFLNEDGTYNKTDSIKQSGKYAGVCYNKEGYYALINEDDAKTMRRINLTMNNGHLSVYDHNFISFNMQNIPKILAMVLNNEHMYTTSEKSARYTKIEKKENSIITDKEINLYNKCREIFEDKISEEYHEVFNDTNIKKLAQENARYLVTVFMPTQMIYTTSLRQINYLASIMFDYIKNADLSDKFQRELAKSMQEFLRELNRLKVLEPGLMRNEKNRKISLFGKNINLNNYYYGNVYETNYKSSFAYLAQAQRHRTLNYKMEFLEKPEFYVPPIIEDSYFLKSEWLQDMSRVKEVIPQGELVKIRETGMQEDFVLKLKERLCSAAQLEIARQTKDILNKYIETVKVTDQDLYNDMLPYSHGARCTFPDFECTEQCNFKEGINLKRRI